MHPASLADDLPQRASARFCTARVRADDPRVQIDKEKERRVHGTRCRQLINCMPYRDPARRAAWMREYRKGKKRECVPASKRVPVYPVHIPVNTAPALFVSTESRDLEAIIKARDKSIQLPRPPVNP